MKSRQTVRAWVTAEIKNADAVSVTAITDAAVKHFAKDRAFVTAFLNEMLRPIVGDLVNDVVATSRTQLVVGDEVITREQFKERVARKASRWERWLEHVGDRHIRLMEMTAPQLMIAAAERRGRAETETKTAELWEKLAAKLEGGQAVKERFTPMEIEAMASTLEVRRVNAA